MQASVCSTEVGGLQVVKETISEGSCDDGSADKDDRQMVEIALYQ